MSTMPLIELNDGDRIAQLGFGTDQIEPDDTCTAAKTAAHFRLRPLIGECDPGHVTGVNRRHATVARGV